MHLSNEEFAAVVERELSAFDLGPFEDVLSVPLAEIGLDSFAIVTLLLELEQTMTVTIPDEIVEAASTLGEIWRYCASS